MPPESSDPIFYFHIEDTVTNVGLRLALAGIIPDELKLRVDNLSEHKVRVYLQGNEEAINNFHNHIKERKTLGKAKNFTISELKPINEEQGCFSIDTNRFFHKLECEQMGKFVDVGLDIQKEMKRMREDLKELPKNIAMELGKFLGKK
ncbi:MAG: acylphosphatase [Candidatus Altiarchaeota archaeon]|nr:acylphosphatase [Candidatus Altiarchaeota archaeon]